MSEVAAGLRYDVLVGTGGLGTGMFVQLVGDHTLGREESRSAALLEQRDRCKLHIITHYVKTFLGPGFRLVPVGAVGQDEPGRTVLAELGQLGYETDHVEVMPDRPTLFSVCFTYPNGDGGNITLDGTASGCVTAADVDRALPVFEQHAGRGIALAAPEVPLAARRRLLELATAHGFLRAASFLSGEIDAARKDGLLDLVDVLSVNIDEAAAAAGMAYDAASQPEEIVDAAIDRLRADNPGMQIVVTAGGRGSWVWDGRELTHTRPFAVPVVNTAGAGDSHLGGLLIGLSAGLDLPAANAFATLVSAQKVTCVHTINPDVDLASTIEFARAHGASVPAALRDALLSLV